MLDITFTFLGMKKTLHRWRLAVPADSSQPSSIARVSTAVTAAPSPLPHMPRARFMDSLRGAAALLGVCGTINSFLASGRLRRSESRALRCLAWSHASISVVAAPLSCAQGRLQLLWRRGPRRLDFGKPQRRPGHHERSLTSTPGKRNNWHLVQGNKQALQAEEDSKEHL
ncbi:hypothetical protein NDU88_000933 [Pleurodeles waltl]|uniref:Uncharacterized protein n=1 Tax=Pleurodeles waltl TaxID=8319 RepID=A0AAV7LZK4_PLEWA|nr:hypothetical protein NDU88_000933 [Pleurodeles waltl]